MPTSISHHFQAQIQLIGINPYVLVPDDILEAIFEQAGKNKGPIPVKGKVNGKAYTQTLMKYAGYWRLYINLAMLDQSPKRIGELIQISIQFDPADRTLTAQGFFTTALEAHPEAKQVFESLSKSKQQELIRFFTFLKTEKSIKHNLERMLSFLHGNGRFMGRDKP